jgi:hypothetical protein
MGPTQPAAVNSTEHIDEGRSLFGYGAGRHARSVLKKSSEGHSEENDPKPANPFFTSRFPVSTRQWLPRGAHRNPLKTNIPCRATRHSL